MTILSTGHSFTASAPPSTEMSNYVHTQKQQGRLKGRPFLPVRRRTNERQKNMYEHYTHDKR